MLIAVDTNVLIDQARDDPVVWDAMTVLRERKGNCRFIVLPTVLEELGFQIDLGGEKAEAAEKALSCLSEWGYETFDIRSADRGITREIGRQIRKEQFLPEDEMNDSLVIAEAALVGCVMLISKDSHLLEAQAHPKFRGFLKGSDVKNGDLVIADPRTVNKFWKR